MTGALFGAGGRDALNKWNAKNYTNARIAPCAIQASSLGARTGRRTVTRQLEPAFSKHSFAPNGIASALYLIVTHSGAIS